MPICAPLESQIDNEEVKANQLWLSDKDADLIVEIIKRNKCTKLVLARNDLADEAAGKIAEAMASNTSIKFLSLAGNKITDEGGKKLAEMLKQNSTLENFFVCSNQRISKETQELMVAANKERPKPMPLNLYGLVVSDEPVETAKSREAKERSRKA